MEKYKKARNKATNKIRQDTKDLNGKRIEEAKDENEIWKIVKEISQPKSCENWSLTSDKGSITEEKEMANEFNNLS